MKSDLYFLLLESITPTARPVTITFLTKETYTPAGYKIIGSLTRVGTAINVRLDSVEASEFGGGMTLPATVDFELGALLNDLYDLAITTNGKTIHALVLVSDTSYITKIQPNDMITPSRPRLLRVPTTTIWGEVESITPGIQQEFIDSLISLGAKPPSLTLGYYRYFTVVSPDSFSVPSAFAIGMRYAQHFLFRFDSDTSITRGLLKSFAKRYGDSLYVSLFGGRGQMYCTTELRWDP